ncbi:MAG: endonuclease/exonuclease/phosphatase family protein, partial [Clostridia bacterium]|nr:endonuclease/exonuclease/phosphatase family protein [Clostridia bacterium]
RIECPDGYSKRFKMIKDKLSAECPDIICFQEMSEEMLMVTVRGLDDYYIVGGGRDDKRLGESVVVAFKKDRFVIGNCRTKWLSPTPYMPASKFPEDQSGCPRVSTMVSLTDIESMQTIRIYNTHLDHIGKIARLNGITQILEDMNEDTSILPYPIILTGDLNATPDSDVIEAIKEKGGLVDVSDKFEKTFNNYGKPYREWDASKIDYIFTSSDITCEACALWDEMPDGKYMSDHFALCAVLEI